MKKITILVLIISASICFAQVDFIYFRDGGDLNSQPVNDSTNIIEVDPDGSITGTVKINVVNNHGAGAIVPVVYTPSWGDHETSWTEIENWAPTGSSNYDVPISLTAPSTPGTYYLIFSSHGQTASHYVASLTSWPCGYSVWNDGNDLAGLNEGDMMGTLTDGYTTCQVWDCGESQFEDSCVGCTYVKIIVGDIIFYDNFTNDLSNWNFYYQGSYTIDIITDDGNPQPCLLLDDHLSHGTYGITNQTFSYLNKTIEISADIKHGNAAFTDQRSAYLQIAKYNYFTTYGFFCSISTRASTHPTPDVAYCRLIYEDGETELWEESGQIPIANGDIWNNAKIRIRSDRIVEFFINNSLIYTSTNPITDNYDGDAAVKIGDRKSLYDNVVAAEMDYADITADFTSNITEGDAPLEVSFTDSSIAMGTTITSWEWDFGDGNTSTEQNPVYTYPTAGTYDVSLIVSDGIISDTLLIEDYITAFGLVADYPFTNGSVADSSGNGNDGTNNGATPTIDRFGNSDCAFDFDGSSHITVNDFNFGANNSITISAWAYCEGTNNDHPRVIDFLPSSYWVNYQTVSDIYMFGMASGYYGFSHNNNINRWKHIIAQYDHTNSKMKLYVDGIIVDSVNVSVSTPELTNIFIGDSGEIPNQRNFIGKIDDISIYNTILNQNEINSLYHSGGWPYINADFTSNVTEGDAPLEVSFTDSSIAMGTTITSWEWYFGDGNTSTEQNPVYIYETAGIYDVTLIVSDGVVSDTLTIEDYITVNFDVDFIAVPTSGFFPLVVDFTDLTIGNPTSWHWDYDDGNSSSEQNPSHTFWNSGVYDIELIVSNAAKTDTLVKSAYITVDDLLTPLNEPQIYRMEDMPNDQGHQLRIYWVRSQRDESEIHPYILFYSLWRRMDDLPRNANSIQIITENELPEYNEKDIVNNRIFISGRDEYWEGVGTVGAIHQSWYSYVAPTLIDSNSTDTNFSFFKIYAHTNINTFYESVPDSGYSVDNIPPNPADEVYIAVNGNNIELSWDEVSDGSYSGNSYPEQNGVWYKIYASDEPYFVCDETNLIDTVSDPEYIYTVGTEDKKFFKIVVSDQP